MKALHLHSSLRTPVYACRNSKQKTLLVHLSMRLFSSDVPVSYFFNHDICYSFALLCECHKSCSEHPRCPEAFALQSGRADTCFHRLLFTAFLGINLLDSIVVLRLLCCSFKGWIAWSDCPCTI